MARTTTSTGYDRCSTLMHSDDSLDASLYPKVVMDHAWKNNYGKMYGKYFIEDVIFNPPATVVFWKDGTKTAVKCKADEEFDYEKGLAMAICKKLYGNGYAFHKLFKKWIPEKYDTVDDVISAINKLRSELGKEEKKQPCNPYIDMPKGLRASLENAFKETNKNLTNYYEKMKKKGD